MKNIVYAIERFTKTQVPSNHLDTLRTCPVVSISELKNRDGLVANDSVAVAINDVIFFTVLDKPNGDLTEAVIVLHSAGDDEGVIFDMFKDNDLYEYFINAGF